MLSVFGASPASQKSYECGKHLLTATQDIFNEGKACATGPGSGEKNPGCGLHWLRKPETCGGGWKDREGTVTLNR